MNYFNSNRNISMLIDFYEFTMANGFLSSSIKDKEVVFDMFYRQNPDNGGYVVFSGLDTYIDFIENLHFSLDDISFLASLNKFDAEFLSYLSTFKFSGDIYAIEEGTPVFPNEPLVCVKANIIEAQLIETMTLLCFNFSSLISTKANRIKIAAKGKAVMEFGSRRAQSFDAAILGTRASYIGGVTLSANVLANQLFDVKAIGTMAHSWIQSFDNEYEAFKAYALKYPDDTTLLIDTYNVIDSGIINAIKVNNEVLKPMGKYLKAVRIDSGDLAYLSKKVRNLLDDADMQSTQICLSNSLDEYLIKSLLEQEACVDSFGVGERLITAKSDPVFGGVYKLSAVIENGEVIPRIKLSENMDKITNPGFKTLYRLYDKSKNIAIADLITLHDEVINDSLPLTIFDPVSPWKKLTLTDYYAVNLHVPIFKSGKLVYNRKSLAQIRTYCDAQLNTLYPELKRFENPHTYYVDLSNNLYNLKIELLSKMNKIEK